MVRLEAVPDPDGDAVEAQERHDRELEKGSDPSIWLGPLERCDECGLIPREFYPGFWVCSCGLPVLHMDGTA